MQVVGRAGSWGAEAEPAGLTVGSGTGHTWNRREGWEPLGSPGFMAWIPGRLAVLGSAPEAARGARDGEPVGGEGGVGLVKSHLSDVKTHVHAG